MARPMHQFRHACLQLDATSQHEVHGMLRLVLPCGMAVVQARQGIRSAAGPQAEVLRPLASQPSNGGNSRGTQQVPAHSSGKTHDAPTNPSPAAAIRTHLGKILRTCGRQTCTRRSTWALGRAACRAGSEHTTRCGWASIGCQTGRARCRCASGRHPGAPGLQGEWCAAR